MDGGELETLDWLLDQVGVEVREMRKLVAETDDFIRRFSDEDMKRRLPGKPLLGNTDSGHDRKHGPPA